MIEDKYKLTVYTNGKTLETLDLIADEIDQEIEEVASLLLAYSIEKIRDLYRAIFLTALGAEQ